tara:strand:+ start:739 stop:918 length:180 start_codon:yes stop_codon:yes gene_type:complete
MLFVWCRINLSTKESNVIWNLLFFATTAAIGFIIDGPMGAVYVPAIAYIVPLIIERLTR